MVGEKFNKLEVLERSGSDKNRKALWLCRCSCGNYTTVRTQDLKTGCIKSCGCQSNAKKHSDINKHNHYKNLYKVWCGMLSRCGNEKDTSYRYYGFKGIIVEPEWLEFRNFFNWSIQNGYKQGLQIDRKNPTKNYCSENCRWISTQENCSLARKGKRIIELENKSIKEVATTYHIETKEKKYFAKPTYCILTGTKTVLFIFKRKVSFLFKYYSKAAEFLNITPSSLYYRMKHKEGQITDNWKMEKITKDKWFEYKNQNVKVIR